MKGILRRISAAMLDLSMAMSLVVLSDSSAARGFAARQGLGRMRHVQTDTCASNKECETDT